MPIYEYRCPSCSHRFELRQGFSAESTTPCPACGATAGRVLHAAGIVFKGSGWHSTDYRSSKSRGSSDGGGDGESASASTSTESGEKKAEAPAAPAPSSSDS